MFGKDLRKVWSRYKGVKRTNRQKVRIKKERKKERKKGKQKDRMTEEKT